MMGQWSIQLCIHDLVSQVECTIPLGQIVQNRMDGREVGIAARLHPSMWRDSH